MNAQLAKLCKEQRAALKQLGGNGARKLQVRLTQLVAATRLGDIVLGRPHPLKGDRAGQFALDLDGGARLVLEPAGEVPRSADGTIDWPAVTSVRIVFIGDYHD